MEDLDIKFMKIALKEAEKALLINDIPVGAIIVKDNKVIAKGYNKKIKSNRVCDHAEIIALTNACKKLKNWRLEDCSIYITLEPCPMCASAIEQSRISKIVTAAVNKNEKTKEISEKILCNRQVIKDIMKEDSEKLLEEFFKKIR